MSNIAGDLRTHLPLGRVAAARLLGLCLHTVLGSAMQLLHRCSEIYCWEEAVATLNHYIWAQSVILALTGAMPLDRVR